MQTFFLSLHPLSQRFGIGHPSPYTFHSPRFFAFFYHTPVLFISLNSYFCRFSSHWVSHTCILTTLTSSAISLLKTFLNHLDPFYCILSTTEATPYTTFYKYISYYVLSSHFNIFISLTLIICSIFLLVT